MLEKWGWKVGDHIPISSNIYSRKDGSHTWDFTIVGSFAGRTPQSDSNLMLLSYDYFDETRSFGELMLDRVGGPDSLPQLLAESDFVVLAAPLTPENFWRLSRFASSASRSAIGPAHSATAASGGVSSSQE